MPPFCQKQLHVLLGILGVLVTEWSQRVNFCIIRGALRLLIMNRRTREMKSPQEWKSPGEASLPVAFGINYVSRPRPQRGKSHALPRKQGFTNEELLIFGQYWSPGNSPTPPNPFIPPYISFQIQPLSLMMIMTMALSSSTLSSHIG